MIMSCMSNPTAPGKPDSEEQALPAVDPADVPVGGASEQSVDEEYRTEVFELMTPRARGAIVDAMLQSNDEPMTAQEIADSHSGVTVPSFNRHRESLVDEFGILLNSGKRGNAQTYRLNTNHPAVQLLGMINQVFTHGTTPPLLDEQFYRDPDV